MLHKRKKYSQIWGDRLTCDFDQEWESYRYLCEDMGFFKRRRYEKKGKGLFCSYGAWNQHIEEIFAPLSEEEKREFMHFLRHKTRVHGINDKMFLHYLLPIVICYFGIMIEDFCKMISQEESFVITIAGALLFVIGLIWLFFVCYKGIRMDDLKKAFYQDLLEILEHDDA